MQSTLVRCFPDNYAYKFWMAVIQESLGRLLMKHDRLPEARIALQDCIDSFQTVLEKDAKAGFVRFILAGNYMNLAEVLHGMGEDKAAEEATHRPRTLAKSGNVWLLLSPVSIKDSRSVFSFAKNFIRGFGSG